MVATQEDLEDVGAKRQAANVPGQSRPVRDSGPLQGFNDPASRTYRPLVQIPDEQEDQVTAQEFRAGTVEAQRRQEQQTHAGQPKSNGSIASSIANTGKQRALSAGAEAIVSKLGAQGFAIVTIIKFLREHKTIAFIILFFLGSFSFFLISFVIITIYYSVNPCEALKLPLASLIKIVITLTNLQCVLK